MIRATKIERSYISRTKWLERTFLAVAIMSLLMVPAAIAAAVMAGVAGAAAAVLPMAVVKLLALPYGLVIFAFLWQKMVILSIQRQRVARQHRYIA